MQRLSAYMHNSFFIVTVDFFKLFLIVCLIKKIELLYILLLFVLLLNKI
jgi:hypothetical protein